MYLFKTDPTNVRALILRLALGTVMLVHGLQKLGVFGGQGPSGVVAFFGSLGVPAILAYLVILSESVGSIGIILGFLTRICAAAAALIMLGAILLVHLSNGFWMGDGGYEFHILAFAMALALLLAGGGMWSIDAAIAKGK